MANTMDVWPLHLELPLVAATLTSASYLHITIVFAFFYWLLNARVRAMVNVMSMKIYEAYEGGSAKQSSSSLHHQLTQLQLKKREQLAASRDTHVAKVEGALFDTKNSLWSTNGPIVPEVRPSTGKSCSKCTPTSPKSATPSNRVFPSVDILKLSTFAKLPKGLIAGVFPAIYHCSTFPGYDFPYIYSSVLADETVKDAIRETAEEMAAELSITDQKGLQLLLSNNAKRAEKILTRMHSKLSNFVIRMVAWVLLKTLPLLLKCMAVPAHQIQMLKEASTKGLPMIYLPLHRSHVDYIAVTLILCNNGLRSPLVAAGANLNIPFFGRVLQGLGAFFIKRRIDPVSGKKDKIYRAILHTYMTHCIEAGHHFEFFIEGGRTRTGKPCMPKGGLLSVFVDAYLSGVLEDALLIPVSVNYEKIVEGSFVRELTGEQKQPETFLGAIKGIWKALTDRYGMVRVDFNEPFSLHELVKSFQSRRSLTPGFNGGLHVVPSSSSLYGTDIAVEEQRHLVDSIARHIIYDCSRSTAVMSTNALAFLLLHVHREGATLGELTFSLDVLRNELSCSDKDVGFCGESKDVLETAIELLGPGLVQKERTPEGDWFIKPVTILPNVIELSYYSNTVLPHFAMESVLALTALSLTSNNNEAEVEAKVNGDSLIDSCAQLCEILQYEFIFTKTCQNLTDAIYDTIDHLTILQILVKQDMPKRAELKNYDIADDDEDEVYIPPQRYTVKRENSKLAVFSKMVKPIVDAYYVTMSTVKSSAGRPVEESALVKEALAKTTSLIKEGIIPNGETLSTEFVRNCLRLLDKWGAVSVTTVGGKRIYTVDESKAETALNRISVFNL